VAAAHGISSMSCEEDDDSDSVAAHVAKGLDNSKRRKHADNDEDSVNVACGEEAVAANPFSLVQEPTICDGFTPTPWQPLVITRTRCEEPC
jgi:hypothetical protein